MTDQKGNREGRLVCLIGAFLIFGTFACYWPVRHFDFVNLDDPLYVFKTRMVQKGLSWPGVVWAFKTMAGGNWNPLVWLSHMADCQLYGLRPGGHHVTNVLLHAANVLLLLLVLRSMTGAIWRSGLVAAIFAWHPMHVESVAWVSERKDVLSTLFWLLTMWAYAVYAKGRNPHRKSFYSLTLLFFILGLMSKPMLVTLPFVLLLLDYWPLQRIEPAKKLVMEKTPFFILAIAGSAVALCAQDSAGAMTGTAPLPLRLANAPVVYVTYLGKLFWPVDLAVFYPFPPSISMWRCAGALLLLGAVSGAAICAMKRHRYLGVGWFWFLGTLAPVIGIVQVGLQSMADRYTYIPYIGLGIIMSWGIAELVEAWPHTKGALAAVAALGLGCCFVSGRTQVKYWRDNTTLYEHALNVTSDNFVAHSNLGDALLDERQLDAAIAQYQEVIRLMPFAAKPINNLGAAYALQDKVDAAIPLFLKAVSLDPKLEQAHFNLGKAYFLKGRNDEALAELKTATQLDPDDIDAQNKLAEMLIKTGNAANAISYCEAAVAADAENAHARYTLGSAFVVAKRFKEALASYEEALRLSPDTPQCLNAVAWMEATCPAAEIRNGSEAVRLAEKACQITKRQNADLLDTLSAADAEAGRFDEAIKTAEEIRTLAASSHDTNLAERTQQRLKLYKAGKPYRDDP